MMHTPVLLKEVIEGLHLEPNDTVIDCTLGDGGHAEALLEAIAPHGKIFGIDKDEGSLARAKKNLENYKDRVTLVQGNFRELASLVPQPMRPIRGILLDLGWSSSQLTTVKGLSFDFDAPLDMRIGGSGVRTAADILNKSSAQELGEIFRRFGGEKRWHTLAHAIVRARQKKSFEKVSELVAVIYASVSPRGHSKIHPATRVFQALRIVVNDELSALKDALPAACALLVSGGRLAVISFHSLEDRIVKQYFGRTQELRVITKRPITPGVWELQNNARSRSAKLRIAEKL